MAFTKAQLEAIKNTLLASNQPILANQHREQIQSMIDEMYDAQSRADILVGVQADTITGGSDTFIVFRNGEAYQIPLSLLNANTLANLGDVFISNLADGEILVYNAIADRWENKNIFLGFAISNLSDVELNNLSNGDILRYNAATDKWDNVNLASILAPYALLTDLDAYQLLSEKGQANGYAQLDTGAKLPISIIPDSVLGQVEYEGTWNATTNTPTLPNTPDKKGEYYVVSTAGTFVGIDFEIGDWIISNGVEWEKVNNTDAVRTVFGRLGDVVANANDYAGFYVRHDTNNQGLNNTQKGNARTNINAEPIFAKNTGFNKNFGTVAGTVAQGNDSRFHAALTLGTANGLGLTGQQLSLGLAGTSATGALSSTDFNTFNNKQNALTNPITGTGAAGRVAFWTGAGTQSGSSKFIWDNSNSRLSIEDASSTNKSSIEFFAGRLKINRPNSITEAISIGGGNDELHIRGVGKIFHSAINFSIYNTVIDGDLVFGTNNIDRWRILNTGIFQSNGAQTIQTSTGNLTLATGGGNGNILLSPNGTGNVGIGTTAPSEKLDVNGSVRIRTISNATGNFLTTSATGVIQQRTPEEVLTDIGGVGGTGASGQVSFFNSSGSIIGDSFLTFDSVNAQLNIRKDVNASVSFPLKLRNQAGGGSESVGIILSAQNGQENTQIRSIREGAATNEALSFFTGQNNVSTEKWRITSTGIFQSNGAQTIQTSTGNLTLATGGGNGNILLSPNGTGQVIYDKSLDPFIDIRESGVLRVRIGDVGATNDGVLQLFNQSGIEQVRLRAGANSFFNGGNVGIGTTAPSERLQVSGGNILISGGTSGSRSLTIQALTAGDSSINLIPSTGGIGKLNVNGSFPLALSTNGTERLRVTQTGNLIVALAGIPTSDPNIEGQLYRNNTGQLFISLGVV